MYNVCNWFNWKLFVSSSTFCYLFRIFCIFKYFSTPSKLVPYVVKLLVELLCCSWEIPFGVLLSSSFFDANPVKILCELLFLSNFIILIELKDANSGTFLLLSTVFFSFGTLGTFGILFFFTSLLNKSLGSIAALLYDCCRVQSFYSS